MELNDNEVIEDLLIDNLKIIQNIQLYRFTSDSVLLSRFAKVKANDNIADFCSGSGIVAFHFYALNKSVPNLKFTLFEMQSELSDLSKRTVILNKFDNFIIKNCKIQDIPNDYRENFSLVLCNPPYERGGFDNVDYKKAICRKEITINLDDIAKMAAMVLKFGGRIDIVNRADRLAELCYTFKRYGIEIKRIQFVAGKEGEKPYLLMAEGVKGGKPCSEILPILINS